MTRGRTWIVFLATVALHAHAHAQVLQLQGGSSTLFSAHGGSLEARSRSFTTSVGAGWLGDRFTVGASTRKSLRRLTLTLGDEAVDFLLPTDVFGGVRYVPLRGAGIEARRGTTRLKVLGGTTTSQLGAPFFRAARGSTPGGLLFFESSPRPSLRFYSRNAFAERQTSIHGMEWRAATPLVIAGAAGIGAGAPYAASSATLDTGWLSATGAYVRQRTGFRRMVVDSPMSAELAGENVSVSLRPTPLWTVGVARQAFAAEEPSSTLGRTITNQVSGGLNLAGMRLTGAAYDSHGPTTDHLGTSLSIGRRITPAIDAVVDYFRSAPGSEAATGSVVGRLQEEVSARLTLSQFITRSAGETAVNLGGEFLSNPVRVSVTHQMMYAPLRPGNPFVQVLGIDLRLNLFDSVAVQAGTYATPDGRLRYTISATHIQSMAREKNDGRSRGRLERYLVRGRVQDVDGKAVAGAVIYLGDEAVITNADGEFFHRVSSKGKKGGRRLALTVATDEFLAPGRFEVVSAPGNVTPDVDGRGAGAMIVVRRT